MTGGCATTGFTTIGWAAGVAHRSSHRRGQQNLRPPCAPEMQVKPKKRVKSTGSASLAEMHGSRTHPGPCSDPTLVLKTRRLTGTDAPPGSSCRGKVRGCQLRVVGSGDGWTVVVRWQGYGGSMARPETVRKTVGRTECPNPVDRVWALRQFLRDLGVARREEEYDAESIRKVVGRPRGS